MMSRGDLSHIPKSKKDSARCSLSALLFRGNQPRAYKIDYIHSSFFVKDRGESAQRFALAARATNHFDFQTRPLALVRWTLC